MRILGQPYAFYLTTASYIAGLPPTPHGYDHAAYNDALRQDTLTKSKLLPGNDPGRRKLSFERGLLDLGDVSHAHDGTVHDWRCERTCTTCGRAVAQSDDFHTVTKGTNEPHYDCLRHPKHQLRASIMRWVDRVGLTAFLEEMQATRTRGSEWQAERLVSAVEARLGTIADAKAEYDASTRASLQARQLAVAIEKEEAAAKRKRERAAAKQERQKPARRRKDKAPASFVEDSAGSSESGSESEMGGGSGEAATAAPGAAGAPAPATAVHRRRRGAPRS